MTNANGAPDFDLSGKRALITGAGQGVGRAIARALAAHGATVVVNDIFADRAQSVADEVRAAGGSADTAVFDVTSWSAVEAAITAAGPFDILVNNAGNVGNDSWSIAPFAESDPASWDKYLRVNLWGVMHCIRATLPGMIAQGRGGRIVTVVSDSARAGDPGLGPYAAAKAGAAALTRSIATEVGRYGITANNVSLATIRPPSDVPDSELAKTDAALKKRISEYVIRRRGEPEDVAGLVTYLVSPAAEWVTGQTYPVNGGYTFSL